MNIDKVAPAWYEHTLRDEAGLVISTIITDHEDDRPHGKPDVDHDKIFSVSVEPLYRSAPPAPAAVVDEQDALLSVLEQCAAALWDDSREIRMDSTMMFGSGYDWDGWENYREELHTRAGSFAIWPAHGTYSAYGGEDGTYWNQRFATSAEAKSAVVKHLVKLDPDHPAVKACLVVNKVREHLAAPSFSAEQSAPVRSVVMPKDWEGRLMDEMDRRFELPKSDDDYMVNHDTQIGVEFAIDWLKGELAKMDVTQG